MRSTHPYPVFQERRYKMDTWPLRYKHASVLNLFKLQDWRERGYEIKHKAMVDQKREPVFWAGPNFHKSIGTTWEPMKITDKGRAAIQAVEEME